MTPEQIAASLRSIPYGVGNKAADLIEQQVSELEALRAERDAASERRKAEVISLQKACRALKTQVKGLNRKLAKVQGAEGNFSERADMMLRIEYQRKELATLREERGAAERFQHIKRGTTYTVIARGKLQTDAPLTDYAELVAYRCDETGDVWFRPESEFTPDRFRAQKGGA